MEEDIRFKGVSFDDANVGGLFSFHDRVIGDSNHQRITFKSNDFGIFKVLLSFGPSECRISYNTSDLLVTRTRRDTWETANFQNFPGLTIARKPNEELRLKGRHHFIYTHSQWSIYTRPEGYLACRHSVLWIPCVPWSILVNGRNGQHNIDLLYRLPREDTKRSVQLRPFLSSEGDLDGCLVVMLCFCRCDCANVGDVGDWFIGIAGTLRRVSLSQLP